MMRFTFLLLVLPFVFIGCRKGKTLPDIVYVHYEGPVSASMSPTGAFSPFDPYDWNEPVHYPSYVSVNDGDDLAQDFNEYLTRLLKKNNIVLTSEPAEYTLSIGYLSVSEGLNRESYTDTCSFWNEPAYVYYSDLNAQVKATLRKNGAYINDWTRNASSSERVKDQENPCEAPKVGSIWRKPGSLVSQLAEEIRMKVSRQLYDLEVN
jgi:hypothetical protein